MIGSNMAIPLDIQILVINRPDSVPINQHHQVKEIRNPAGKISSVLQPVDIVHLFVHTPADLQNSIPLLFAASHKHSVFWLSLVKNQLLILEPWIDYLEFLGLEIAGVCDGFDYLEVRLRHYLPQFN